MTTIDLRLDQETVDLIAVKVAEALGQPVRGWFNVAQAADYLACKPQRIYDLVSQGKLKSAKDGRRVLFRREWLDQALA